MSQRYRRTCRQGAVREQVGVDDTARLLQDPVVSDCFGCREGFGDLVGPIEQPALGDRRRPGTGEAISLQFLGDTELVRCVRRLLLGLAHPVTDTGDVLDVVTVLVRHDVLCGEVAGGGELVLELL